MDDFNLDASLSLLRRVAELEPMITAPLTKRDQSERDQPEIVPTLLLGGRKIYLNSHFWSLVKENIRLYYDELERDLPNCQAVSLDRVLKEADDMSAQGFIAQKILQPLGTASGHISLSSADIGAQLGSTAFVAKAVAEVGEGVLSKVVGGGGVHVFCAVIDAYIVFGTRSLQTMARNVGYSKRFDSGFLRSFWYQALVKASIKRAQKRVSFEFEPFEVDAHELEEVDKEGPRRFWGILGDGKRAAWIRRVARKARRGEKPLGENEISRIAQISRKSFLKGGFKRFLFLNPHFMRGNKLIDQSLRSQVIWILSVQENILHRSLLKSPDEAADLMSKNAMALPAYASDDVREGLAAEFSDGDPERAAQLNLLLMDVERIFDPSVDRRIRYLDTLILESILTGFLYKLLETHISAMYPQGSNWFITVGRAFQIHWFTGRYAFHAHELADFLRVASVQDGAEELMRNKYAAMESLLRIFQHLKLVLPREGEAVEGWLASIRESNRSLKSFQPWKEKRSHYSFIPFVPWREDFANWDFLPDRDSVPWLPAFPSRAPLCVDMDRRKGGL